MKPVRYVLEVRRPDNYHQVWALFEAATPWIAFHVGDIVDPGAWPGSQSPKRVLRVLRVEHEVVDEGPHLAHRLRLATEEVDGYPRVESAPLGAVGRKLRRPAAEAQRRHARRRVPARPSPRRRYLPGGRSPVGEGPGGRPPGGPTVVGAGPGGRPPGGAVVVGVGPGGRPPGGAVVVTLGKGIGRGKPPGGKNPPGGGAAPVVVVLGGAMRMGGGSAGGTIVGAMVGAMVGATVGAITTCGGGGGGGGGASSTDLTKQPARAAAKKAHPVIILADLARCPMLVSSAPTPPRLLP